MLYIFNKIISNTKSIEYALTVIYGLNKYQSQKICKNFGINPKITINKIKKNKNGIGYNNWFSFYFFFKSIIQIS